MHQRIFIGLLSGIAAGLALQGLRHSGLLSPAFLEGLDASLLSPVGKVFLGMLRMVVAPLVFASLALGVAQLGRLDRLGRLASRTFALFALNMAVGTILGLLLMNWLQPGAGIDAAARSSLVASQAAGVAKAQAGLAAQAGKFNVGSLVEMFFPANWITSLADPNLQILPLIAFALLCGMAATTLSESQRVSFIDAMDLIARIGTKIVDFALALAPYAVACLMASAVVRFGAGVLGPLLLFVFGVLGVMALHLFGSMTVLLKIFTKVPPGKFFRGIRTVMLTAFSTSSSNATLPTSLRVARDDLGVSAPTAGFVLPLGATMNMSGTALYEGCVVLFVAQAYGIHLDLAQQAILVLLTVLSAVAVSGIPGASLPLIIGLLGNFGIPAEGLALVLGFDRILDMARTVLNVAADLVTAVIVDQPEPAPASP